jgi:hypothetical protein
MEVDLEIRSKLDQIEVELAEIKNRNQRVELEKAWETSTFRKVAILCVTYVLISIVFYSIGVSRPETNAIVPTIAYFLSTLTFPKLKSCWLKKRNPQSK